MRTKSQDLLPLIQKTAVRAGSAYDKKGQAFEAERHAEVVLLEKAIEASRPALPSICSRVAEVPEAVERAELIPDLYLLVDGRLAHASLPGSPSVMVITPETALDSYDLTEILRSLAHKFSQQVAGREPSMKAALLRAERLEALAKLVE